MWRGDEPESRRLLKTALPLAALGALASLAKWVVAATEPAARRMPVLFIGHGSPMNAIEDNAFSRFLRGWSKRLPRPNAILVVSAHWLTPGVTAVDVQPRPRTIHDFGGYPKALFDMLYPATGSPAFACEVMSVVRRAEVQASQDWGLDHGTWTVLHHLFPAADIAVFQLSIDYDKPAAFHHAVGRELAALRDKGVLIVGRGNLVHNLRALASRDDMGLVNDARLAGDAAATAVQTADHYFPFLYALGASDSVMKWRSATSKGFRPARSACAACSLAPDRGRSP